MAIGAMPAPSGVLGAIKTFDAERMRREYVADLIGGHYRPERKHLLLENRRHDTPIQQRILAFLRDHVHQGIPRAWYQLVLGHDAHISIYAELYVKHFHATQRDPFTGELGWWENVGRVSRGKVTTAFRDFLSDQLRTDSTAIGDFKYHEVGTSNTAEANTQTALSTSSGIARATGTQAGTAPDYVSVATVTADATETWQEHGIFNTTSGATLMDRSLISPTVSVVASDTVQFTYTLTMSAEA